MKLLIIFILLNTINVILQTAKSIITVKCGTTAAAVANAIAYGLYTVVLVYMNCDLSLWAKVIVVATTNLVGVYIVKFIENKLNKDKLLKYELTISSSDFSSIRKMLNKYKIQHFTIMKVSDDKFIINSYCYSKDDIVKIETLAKENKLKYFVTKNEISLSK